jgi:hypothetical protein
MDWAKFFLSKYDLSSVVPQLFGQFHHLAENWKHSTDRLQYEKFSLWQYEETLLD